MPFRSRSPKHFKWCSRTSFVKAIFLLFLRWTYFPQILRFEIFSFAFLLTKHWCHCVDLFFSFGRDLFDCGKKVRMLHACAEIGPTHPLEHRRDHRLALAFS